MSMTELIQMMRMRRKPVLFRKNSEWHSLAAPFCDALYCNYNNSSFIIMKTGNQHKRGE